jgi:hypothetical protein
MRRIMRLNEYLTDPFSRGDAGKAICSRGDLAARASAGGCYDSKFTSAKLFKSRSSWAINGPTADGLPPFVWTPAFNSTPHFGLPPKYDFPWVLMTPPPPQSFNSL